MRGSKEHAKKCYRCNRAKKNAGHTQHIRWRCRKIKTKSFKDRFDILLHFTKETNEKNAVTDNFVIQPSALIYFSVKASTPVRARSSFPPDHLIYSAGRVTLYPRVMISVYQIKHIAYFRYFTIIINYLYLKLYFLSLHW